MANRYLRILILRPDKKTEWIVCGWGKYYLDMIRKGGNEILMTFICED